MTQMPVPGDGASGKAAVLGANKRQRQLASEDFVIGEAQPWQGAGAEIGFALRFMKFQKALPPGRPFLLLEKGRIDPLR